MGCPLWRWARPARPQSGKSSRLRRRRHDAPDALHPRVRKALRPPATRSRKPWSRSLVCNGELLTSCLVRPAPHEQRPHRSRRRPPRTSRLSTRSPKPHPPRCTLPTRSRRIVTQTTPRVVKSSYGYARRRGWDQALFDPRCWPRGWGWMQVPGLAPTPNSTSPRRRPRPLGALRGDPGIGRQCGSVMPRARRGGPGRQSRSCVGLRSPPAKLTAYSVIEGLSALSGAAE